MMKHLIFAVLFAVTLSFVSLAHADIVKTKDGEELEGRVIEQTKKFVRLDTGYGILTIPRADIESVTVSVAIVHLKDGRRMEGVITGETSGNVVLRTSYGELTVPRSDIEKIERGKEFRPTGRKEPPKPAKKLSPEERQKLHQKGIQLLQERKLDGAIEVFKKIVAGEPGDFTALYNLACAYSLKDEKKPALDYLEKAIKAGFSDVNHIKKDSDLDNIRNEPGYRALIARSGETTKVGAIKRAEALKKRLGEDYIVETDSERKMIFVTNQPASVLKQLKKELYRYADAQWKTLFDNKPPSYITIVLPSREDFQKLMPGNPGGLYHHPARTLTCAGIGITLRHEFTHALHVADTDAHGQIHPIWLVEGLATCFEESTIVDGKPTPMPNFRLAIARRALATGRYIPWEKFFKLSQGEFGKNSVVCYAEARYIIYYLQHIGKLKEFYDAFCASFKKDRTGKLAMEKVFDKTLAQVQKDFEKWIAGAPEPLGATPKGKPFFGVATSGTAAGMRVTRVVPGSAAGKAGIKPGDIITELAGRKYTNPDMFRKAIRAQKVGEPVKVKLLRGNKEIEFEIKLQPKE